MSRIYYKRKKHRFLYLAITAFILVLLSVIPMRLAIATTLAPSPQAILILGAGSDREEFTAQFAKMYPSLEIWISSGTTPDNAYKIFQAVGIPKTRLHLDNRAVDTVTNFTSLVGDFNKRNFHHLFLITSNFHMPRAKAIAIFVLGSQGIAFTPVSVPSDKPPETQIRILRDSARAMLWVFTGYTGASFKHEL